MQTPDDPTDSENVDSAAATDDEITHPLTVDDRFRFLMQDCVDSIEALRETHEELNDAANGLDAIETVWTKPFKLSAPIGEHGREKLSEAMRAPIPEGGISTRDLVDRIWATTKDEPWGPSFTYELMRRVTRTRRAPIFHNAMLTSAVGVFEGHLAKVVEEYYRAAPEALHTLPKESSKEFSLRELQDLGSIEDAVEIAIERRVTKLMFGSLADWKRFFSERMHIDLGPLSGDWGKFTEIVERRHCIVHNQARASRRYCASNHSVEVGETLHATPSYVQDAITRLELMCLLTVAAVWQKFSMDKRDLIDTLERIAFEALKRERWTVSSRLYEAWRELPLSEQEKRMCQVNLWIAEKAIHGAESIKLEVETWDVSGSDEIFHLARLCLLDDNDAAFELLPRLVQHEKIGGEELATWPLLASLRADSRIDDYGEIMREYVDDQTGPEDSDDSEELTVIPAKAETANPNQSVILETSSSQTTAGPVDGE